jgi:putative ABC transport system permease protein
MGHRSGPPKLADRFLQWFCSEEVLETLQGDLYELYEKRREKSTRVRADILYWADVAGACRPFAFKKKKSSDPSKRSNSNYTTMFKFYFQMSWRSLQKRKVFSLLNISGLSIGIASCFLIFLIVKQEYSYDKYHAKADRIYRIGTTKLDRNVTSSGTPTGVPVAVRNDFQAVAYVAAVSKQYDKLVSVEQNTRAAKYNESVVFVEQSLFDMLDFEWIKGNDQTALSNLNTAVISQSYSQ